MNFSFYILGTPEGRYSQYPDDYTASTLAGLQEGMAGARLVIYRDMDLVHYAYTERLGNNNIIGFCIIFNKARIQRPRQLIKLFRFIIEKRLVESGEVIKYTENGELKFRVKTISECVKAYGQLKGFLNSEFENNASKYNIVPLTSIYNGIKSTGELDRSASDGQIVAMTNLHNKVIVNDESGIEHGYIPQVISSLRTQNQQANETIACLQENNAKLERKKNQYRYVILLTLIVIGCCVGLYLFYNEVNDKEAHISNLENNISKLKTTIENKNTAIIDLQDSITDLQHNIELIASYSASTGATIMNNDSHDNGWILWLKANRKVLIESFYIKGQTSGNVDIGLYDTNDNLIASYETNAVGGEFRKVYVGSEWNIKSGTYYMKILSGVNLQYHSSSDKEYGQFSGGALEVTGCCNYGDRTNSDSKNKHAYYQYFYNIRYRIVE